jgi:hypothetical protein
VDEVAVHDHRRLVDDGVAVFAHGAHERVDGRLGVQACSGEGGPDYGAERGEAGFGLPDVDDGEALTSGVNVVLGVRSGLRRPRALTVGAIAAGSVLVVAGAVARAAGRLGQTPPVTPVRTPGATPSAGQFLAVIITQLNIRSAIRPRNNH